MAIDPPASTAGVIDITMAEEAGERGNTGGAGTPAPPVVEGGRNAVTPSPNASGGPLEPPAAATPSSFVSRIRTIFTHSSSAKPLPSTVNRDQGSQMTEASQGLSVLRRDLAQADAFMARSDPQGKDAANLTQVNTVAKTATAPPERAQGPTNSTRPVVETVDESETNNTFCTPVYGPDSYYFTPSQGDQSPGESLTTIPTTHRPPPNGTPRKGPILRAVKLTVGGEAKRFIPQAEGFDHPFLRGHNGPDESFQPTPKNKPFVAVKIGWEAGIFLSRAAAWYRTADYRANTICTLHPTGEDPLYKCCPTKAEAIRFLGWDPDQQSDPRAFQPKPPPRRFASTIAGMDLGEDPHDWCGEIDLHVPEDDEAPDDFVPREIAVVDTKSVKSAVTQQRTTAPSLAATHSSSTTSLDDEKRYVRILEKVNKETLPYLSSTPSPEEVRKWRRMVTSLLSSPEWQVDGCKILQMKDTPEQSPAFRIRSEALSRALNMRLAATHDDLLAANEDLFDKGYGVTLFHTILRSLQPNSEGHALAELSSLFEMKQQSGELVAAFASRVKDQYHRLHSANIIDLDSLKTILLVRGVLTGAYQSFKGFQKIMDDFRLNPVLRWGVLKSQ